MLIPLMDFWVRKGRADIIIREMNKSRQFKDLILSIPSSIVYHDSITNCMINLWGGNLDTVRLVFDEGHPKMIHASSNLYDSMIRLGGAHLMQAGYEFSVFFSTLMRHTRFLMSQHRWEGRIRSLVIHNISEV